MRILVAVILLLSVSCVMAQTKKTEQKIYTTHEGAIKGYDPVAYFTENKPVKGKKNITYSWEGSTWHFASEENKNTFMAHPSKYAPQYGGYCAYGLAQGYAVKIEPEAWAIEAGKLYLNYDMKVQRDWNKDRSGYIKKADALYKQK